jgi:hypothetical protein
MLSYPASFHANLGITPETRGDHATYLGHWLNVLKEDKRAISQQPPTRSVSPIISTDCNNNRRPPRPDGARLQAFAIGFDGARLPVDGRAGSL